MLLAIVTLCGALQVLRPFFASAFYPAFAVATPCRSICQTGSSSRFIPKTTTFLIAIQMERQISRHRLTSVCRRERRTPLEDTPVDGSGEKIDDATGTGTSVATDTDTTTTDVEPFSTSPPTPAIVKNDSNQTTRESETEPQHQPLPASRLRIRLPIGLKYAFDTVYTVWGFVITVLGAGLSIGLLLNLFGYAYQFEPNGSFRIDTIEQIRTETQFRKEIIKSMRESRQPSSSSSTSSNTINSINSNVISCSTGGSIDRIEEASTDIRQG